MKLKIRSKFNHGFTIIMAIYKVLFGKLYTILTLLTMIRFFGGAHGLAGTKKAPFLKYVLQILQWWDLTQLYLTQRRSKKYINHLTHLLSSPEVNIFSSKISKFCYTKKYRYRLHMNSQFLIFLTSFESSKVFLINMAGTLLISCRSFQKKDILI